MTLLPISRFRSAPRRVLLLSGNRTSVYRWVGGRLLEPLTFAPDDAGLAAFAEYLQLSPREPLYFLVDVVEEDFRLDTVPHVFGRDRAAVLRTKQMRLFREPRYAQALFQGREPGGRRDDRVLFTSIIRPELLEPWLAQIHRYKIPLKGIYSLPVLSAALLRRIPAPEEHVLLVSVERTGGVRQSYFHSGHLKVSRLAGLPRLDPTRLASSILQEVERVRRYLGSLRLVPQGSVLDVYLLSHGGLLRSLELQTRDSLGARFHVVDIESLGPRLGARGDLTQQGLPFADRLFAHLLVTEDPPNYYARPEDTRYYRLRTVGRAMVAASVLLLAGSIGWGGFQVAQAIVQRHDAETLSRQARFYEQRYQAGRAALPPLPADGRQIRQAVELAMAVREYRQSPGTLMATLSRGLDRFPNLRVESLGWAASAHPEGEQARAAERRGGTSRSFRRGRRAMQSSRSTAYYQIGRLSGRIEPFDGNYRAALDEINRFAAALSGLPVVERVDIERMPLDVSPEQRLSGMASARVEQGEADFVLRMVLRTHDEAG